MPHSTVKIAAALLLTLAASNIADAQDKTLVGNWHGFYTFPASAPKGLAGVKIDDTLVLNSDGSFKETEHGPNNVSSIVWGHYTVKDDVMHLTAEKSEPKSDHELRPEDMKFTLASDRLTVTYNDPSSDKPLTIHETLERAP